MAPRFPKLPLTAHFLASGGAEPRPIVLSASGFYRTEAISFIYVPKSCEPSLFIIFSLATSLSRPLHQRPPSATSPSPIAPPSTKFGSPVLLRHRTAGEKEAATVAPPSKRKQPPSRHRPALVATSVAPPSRHRRSSVAASCAPPLPLVVRTSRPLRRAFVAPLRHGSPQPPCTAAPCDCSGEYLAPRSPFPTTVAPPILSGVNSKCVIFFSFCIFFYDLGNCFAF